MPNKLTATEARLAAAIRALGYPITNEHVQQVVVACKVERKARVLSAEQVHEEEEVKLVCQVFAETSGMGMPEGLFVKPTKNEFWTWIKPAQDIVKKHNGKSVELVRAGTSNHVRQGLSVKGVISIMYAMNVVAPANAEVLRATNLL